MRTTNTHSGVPRAHPRSNVALENGIWTRTPVPVARGPQAASEKSASRPATSVGYVLDRSTYTSQRFVRDEIRELRRSGLTVHVFVVQPGGPSIGDPWLEMGAPMHRLPAAAPAASAGADGSDLGDVAMQARWIAHDVTSKQIGHLHGTLTTVDVTHEVRRLTGVRYSFSVAGSEVYLDRRDPRALRHKMCEAEFVVVPSDVSRQQLLVATGAGAVTARHVHRIYRGVDLQRFRFRGDPIRDSRSVLSVCPLVEASGLGDLIDAIAILRDRVAPVRATIVGEGDLEQELRARIEWLRLGDRITLLRAREGRQLLTLMRSHAVMALPYTALPGDGRDGVPQVLVEAMAAGLPVVSTCAMGISEVIEDGWTGRMVAPHDPLWLAGALETLIDSVPLRARMAVDARAMVEHHFALSRNVSHLARLFATAAERGPLT